MNKQFVSMIVGLVALSLLIFGGAKLAEGDTKVKDMDSKIEKEQEDTGAFVEVLDVEQEKLPVVTIEVEGYGTMVAELYPSIAPNTVNNFIDLANSGFYNNLTIHRVMKDFVIQGGDPLGTGMGGPGYSIAGEFLSNGYEENNLAHKVGVLSMARSQALDSAGSQFFIMTGDAPHLDGTYAAFGKLIEGYDVLEVLNTAPVVNVKTGETESKIVIKSISVDTKGQTYSKPVQLNAQ